MTLMGTAGSLANASLKIPKREMGLVVAPAAETEAVLEAVPEAGLEAETAVVPEAETAVALEVETMTTPATYPAVETPERAAALAVGKTMVAVLEAVPEARRLTTLDVNSTHGMNGEMTV